MVIYKSIDSYSQPLSFSLFSLASFSLCSWYAQHGYSGQCGLQDLRFLGQFGTFMLIAMNLVYFNLYNHPIKAILTPKSQLIINKITYKLSNYSCIKLPILKLGIHVTAADIY